MSVLYVYEGPSLFTKAQAREILSSMRGDMSGRFPDCEFVLSETGLTLYWRCDDGFDYGMCTYTLDGQVVSVWDGETSLLCRRWRADADASGQIVVRQELCRMPTFGSQNAGDRHDHYA